MSKEEFQDQTREGDYYRSMGWFEKAVKLYTDVVPRCPANSVLLAEVLAKRSTAFEGMLDYESAEEDALASIAAHNKSHHGYEACGDALCGLRYYHKAFHYYSQVLCTTHCQPFVLKLSS